MTDVAALQITAAHISAAMTRVYLMPKLIGMMGTGTLALRVALSVLAGAVKRRCCPLLPKLLLNNLKDGIFVPARSTSGAN